MGTAKEMLNKYGYNANNKLQQEAIAREEEINRQIEKEIKDCDSINVRIYKATTIMRERALNKVEQKVLDELKEKKEYHTNKIDWLRKQLDFK